MNTTADDFKTVRAFIAKGVGTPGFLQAKKACGNLEAANAELLWIAHWALNTLRDAVVCPDGCPEELEAVIVKVIARAEGR